MAEENHTDDADESRRSFMKKGALASSAAALGLASSGSVAGESNLQQQMGNGLVFSYDYHPGIPFQVVSDLQQPTVTSILGQQIQGGNPPVSDPTDYNGYVVRYQTGGGGIYALVFIQDTALQPGTTYRFTGNAGFFNTEINLLSAGISTGGGGGQTTTTTQEAQDAAETTTPEETTTTVDVGDAAGEEAAGNETTTQNVVVNATETTEGG